MLEHFSTCTLSQNKNTSPRITDRTNYTDSESRVHKDTRAQKLELKKQNRLCLNTHNCAWNFAHNLWKDLRTRHGQGHWASPVQSSTQATHSQKVNNLPRPDRCPQLGRLLFQQDRAALYSKLCRSTSSAHQTHCSCPSSSM